MDFVTLFLPNVVSLSLILFTVLVSIYIAFRIKWLKKLNDGIFNVWMISILSLSLVWMMRASLDSGLNIHLSGAMLFTLMFGWRLGVLGMTLTCILVSLWGNSLLANIGLAIIINAYISISFCYLYFLIVETFFPRNLYIYLFVTSFFGSALIYILSGCISILVLLLFNIYSYTQILNEYLPYYFLLSFAEAFITCGLITLFVVYRSKWVYSFRDEKYLSNN
ncbi:MAG: energy-coupling factor ABC transporter permease [Proteobacteria bacterium]|nr:energy-coupling factor ABC transporter permease [Pseudomonadota bacterium]